MSSHVAFSHTIVLNGAVERVFPLFTPAGEMAWVPDWAPEFLHPANGETCSGMIFRTVHDGEETVWACVDWRPEEHRVRYARVTPASRFGFVDVACRAVPGGHTEATVSYAFTALSAAGEASIAAMSQSRFAAMIEGWRQLIDDHLRSKPPE